MKKQLSLLLVILYFLPIFSQSPTYDIVLKNGQVIDPETELNAIRNIGIIGDKIVEITTESIDGKEVIDVEGLVVAPGFIDLHVHGMTNKAHQYQARDGVTTALELEGGIPFLREWIQQKTGNSIVNFGGSVPHGHLRALAMEQYKHHLDELKDIIEKEGVESPKIIKTLINVMGRSGQQILSASEIEQMREMLVEELSAGALGIGVPVGYYLGASAGEIYSVYEVAAEKQVPIFSHTRDIGMSGIQEAIANALSSGAPLHIVHANSLSLGDIPVTLKMVANAQKRGLDITTELYPYTAASTSIESAIFEEGWKDKLGISYDAIQWEATGERLTEKTFYEYRKKGGIVIIHMMQPEWIVQGIKHSSTMIASDGMPYAPGAHPRTAGTFSRVLGRYVREQKVITLMEALKKMTIMPAQRLEKVAPMMRQKGRLQVGTDADITIFDPRTVIDKADFKGLQFSEGIEYVLVNGQFVVKNGESEKDVFPGKAIIGKYRN